MRVILVAVLVAGCDGADPSFESRLDDMATVSLSHADDAARIVSQSLGIPAESANVRWVVGIMPPAPNGETINGAAIDCDVWVSWFGSQWTSGASVDGPAISFTAFAHEMAHCALWMSGSSDPAHLRAEWWGIGGRVEQANAELAMSGM